MPITLGELKQAGNQALNAGDVANALKIFWRVVDADPHDIEPRLKVADLLVRAQAQEAAVGVYKAVGSFAVRSGHPLIAIVVTKILEDMGYEAIDNDPCRCWSAWWRHPGREMNRKAGRPSPLALISVRGISVSIPLSGNWPPWPPKRRSR